MNDQISRRSEAAIAPPLKKKEKRRRHGHARQLFQTFSLAGITHNIHVNPVGHSATVVTPPINVEPENRRSMLGGVHRITLPGNPYEMARSSVGSIMSAAGLGESSVLIPMGWCKLNFLATVNGETARVTNVLRDGHVDISQ